MAVRNVRLASMRRVGDTGNVAPCFGELGRLVGSAISPMNGSFRQGDGNSSSNVAYAGQFSKVSDQGNWRERNGAVSITTSFGNKNRPNRLRRGPRRSVESDLSTHKSISPTSDAVEVLSCLRKRLFEYRDQDFATRSPLAQLLLAPPIRGTDPRGRPQISTPVVGDVLGILDVKDVAMKPNRSEMTSLEREKAAVFHSWSAQGSINPMMVQSAAGTSLTLEDGTTYLDFSSQLVNVNIGHQHPKVVQAIQEQAGKLATVAPQHGYEARYIAAEMILDHAFEGAHKVFFTNGGTEANEHAIRMARLFTGRNKVMSTYRSYHGATTTSINLTGDHRRWANDTGTAGVVHFFGPFLYRSAFFSETEEQECERALAYLESTIQFEGPNTIAAIILETIPGTAGIMVPPKGYLQGVREICNKYGIIYIADEVMAGFGRAGAWFAHELFDVTPDLVTFAKGVNSGYVPLGGVIINEAISTFFNDRVYPGGLTYSGHPLAVASAVAAMRAMEDEGVIENARLIGEEVLGPGLRALVEKHKVIGEVRGVGVFWALDLVVDRRTKEPLAPYAGTSAAMGELMAACKAQGLLPMMNYHRLHMVPPCTITREEAERGVAMLDKALESVATYYVGQ